MSRCFPFPPPGYEKKPRTESVDFLIKEKHKEKKHKKEKRDKEKREHKEKKDKDRSKDKHKEKKERKEKHKDRKKDNDREKGSISEDRRADDQIKGHPWTLESRSKVDEAKDSNLMEELCRRTKDEGAANRLVGSFAKISTQRNIGGIGAAAASPKKGSVATNKMFSFEITSIQRKNGGSELPSGNVTSSHPRTWGINTASSMESERTKLHEKATFGSGVAQSRYHGISHPIESNSGLVNRKGTNYTAEMEMEKFDQNEAASIPCKSGIGRGKIGTNVASSSFLTSIQRRNDAFYPAVGNVSSIHSRSEGRSTNSIHGGIVEVEKERAKGCGVLQLPVALDKKRNHPIGTPVETKAKDRKGKDDDHGEKKTKAKDKTQEIIVGKTEDEYNKLRILGKKDQVDSLNSNKPSSPHKYNKPGMFGADGPTKRRMDLETNGFLHENVARPDKKLRITPTSQPLSNGRKLEFHPSSPSNFPMKGGAVVSNSKPGNEQIPVAVGLLEKGEFSIKTPHPDAKHLSQIYAIPKMEDLPEVDEQDWLFDNHRSRQKPKEPPKGGDCPQVWARALWIDPPDFFALPYVAPF